MHEVVNEVQTLVLGHLIPVSLPLGGDPSEGIFGCPEAGFPISSGIRGKCNKDSLLLIGRKLPEEFHDLVVSQLQCGHNASPSE
jgi:hypothetical protein